VAEGRGVGMIKCPNCGSTAQVKKDLEITQNKRRNSETKIVFYSCGCGCEFEISQFYVEGVPKGKAEMWYDE
jgi:transcription initiation factor TFIIIB Brf1 subunit/transcription initiation factor TFIIB